MLKLIFASCLLACGIVSFVQGHPAIDGLCTHAGFFPLGDNSPNFYGCYHAAGGGYTLRYLRCPKDQVFSMRVHNCVPIVAMPFAEELDSDDIQNPTVPPTKSADEEETDLTTTDAPSTTSVTEEPPSSTVTEASSTTSVTEEPPSSTVTEAPSTTSVTEEPPASTVTEAPSTTSVTEEPPASTVTEAPPATTETEVSPTTSVTNEPETETTGGETNPTEEPLPACAGTGFLPDTKCTDFIYCVNFDGKVTPFRFSCPDNMQFNPKTHYCEKAYDCNA